MTHYIYYSVIFKVASPSWFWLALLIHIIYSKYADLQMIELTTISKYSQLYMCDPMPVWNIHVASCAKKSIRNGFAKYSVGHMIGTGPKLCIVAKYT